MYCIQSRPVTSESIPRPAPHSNASQAGRLVGGGLLATGASVEIGRSDLAHVGAGEKTATQARAHGGPCLL